MKRLDPKALIEHNREAQQDSAYDGFELDEKDVLIPHHVKFDWANIRPTKFDQLGDFRLTKQQKKVIILAWKHYGVGKIKDISRLSMRSVGMCVDAFWYDCDMIDDYEKYAGTASHLAERIQKHLYGMVKKEN